MHIDTKLELSTHFITRNQLVITSVAYNPKRDEIVVCDGRTLRAFSHRTAHRATRVELTLPQKDMIGTHVIYNLAQNQYILVLQGLEVMIITADLQIVWSEKSDQVSILAAAFSQSRQQLVTTGGRGSIKIYGIERFHKTTSDGWQTLNRFRLRRSISTDYRWLKHVVLNDDDGHILAAHEASVIVWDMESGHVLFRLNDLHGSRIRALAFIPGDQHLLTSSYDGVVKKWSLAASIPVGKPILIESTQCHSKEVRALASDRSGRLFFSCSEDMVVKLWNAERGAELDSHLPSSLAAASLSSYACPPPSQLVYAEAAGSEQGDGVLMVVSGALLSVLRVKDPLVHFSTLSDRVTRAQVVRHDHAGAELPADQRLIFVLSANSALQLLRLETGAMLSMIVPKGLRSHGDGRAEPYRQAASAELLARELGATGAQLSCFCAAPALGNGHVVIGSQSGTLDIIDTTAGGRCVQTLTDTDMTASISAIAVVRAPAGWVCTRQRGRTGGGAGDEPAPDESSAVAGELADGRDAHTLRSFAIITGSACGHISVWGAAQRDVSRTFAAHSGALLSLVPFTVSRLRADDGRLSHALGLLGDESAHHGDAVRAHGQLAEAHAMLSVGSDGTVRLWDLRALQCTPRGAFRTAASRQLTCALVRADGGILLGFDNGSLELWLLLPSALERVRGGADGELATTNAMSSSSFVGRIASLSRSLEPHTERITALERSFASDRFLSASLDGSVLVWHLPSCTALKALSFSAPVTQALFASHDGSFIVVLADAMLLVSREQVKRAKDALAVQETDGSEPPEDEGDDVGALAEPPSREDAAAAQRARPRRLQHSPTLRRLEVGRAVTPARIDEHAADDALDEGAHALEHAGANARERQAGEGHAALAREREADARLARARAEALAGLASGVDAELLALIERSRVQQLTDAAVYAARAGERDARRGVQLGRVDDDAGSEEREGGDEGEGGDEEESSSARMPLVTAALMSVTPKRPPPAGQQPALRARAVRVHTQMAEVTPVATALQLARRAQRRALPVLGEIAPRAPLAVPQPRMAMDSAQHASAGARAREQPRTRPDTRSSTAVPSAAADAGEHASERERPDSRSAVVRARAARASTDAVESPRSGGPAAPHRTAAWAERARAGAAETPGGSVRVEDGAPAGIDEAPAVISPAVISPAGAPTHSVEAACGETATSDALGAHEGQAPHADGAREPHAVSLDERVEALMALDGRAFDPLSERSWGSDADADADGEGDDEGTEDTEEGEDEDDGVDAERHPDPFEHNEQLMQKHYHTMRFATIGGSPPSTRFGDVPDGAQRRRRLWRAGTPRPPRPVGELASREPSFSLYARSSQSPTTERSLAGALQPFDLGPVRLPVCAPSPLEGSSSEIHADTSAQPSSLAKPSTAPARGAARGRGAATAGDARFVSASESSAAPLVEAVRSGTVDKSGGGARAVVRASAARASTPAARPPTAQPVVRVVQLALPDDAFSLEARSRSMAAHPLAALMAKQGERPREGGDSRLSRAASAGVGAEPMLSAIDLPSGAPIDRLVIFEQTTPRRRRRTVARTSLGEPSDVVPRGAAGLAGAQYWEEEEEADWEEGEGEGEGGSGGGGGGGGGGGSSQRRELVDERGPFAAHREATSASDAPAGAGAQRVSDAAAGDGALHAIDGLEDAAHASARVAAPSATLATATAAFGVEDGFAPANRVNARAEDPDGRLTPADTAGDRSMAVGASPLAGSPADELHAFAEEPPPAAEARGDGTPAAAVSAPGAAQLAHGAPALSHSEEDDRQTAPGSTDGLDSLVGASRALDMRARSEVGEPAHAAEPPTANSPAVNADVARALALGISDEALRAAAGRVRLVEGDWQADMSHGPALLFSISLYGLHGAREKALIAVAADIARVELPKWPLTRTRPGLAAQPARARTSRSGSVRPVLGVTNAQAASHLGLSTSAHTLPQRTERSGKKRPALASSMHAARRAGASAATQPPSSLELAEASFVSALSSPGDVPQARARQAGARSRAKGAQPRHDGVGDMQGADGPSASVVDGRAAGDDHDRRVYLEQLALLAQRDAALALLDVAASADEVALSGRSSARGELAALAAAELGSLADALAAPAANGGRLVEHSESCTSSAEYGAESRTAGALMLDGLLAEQDRAAERVIAPRGGERDDEGGSPLLSRGGRKCAADKEPAMQRQSLTQVIREQRNQLLAAELVELPGDGEADEAAHAGARPRASPSTRASLRGQRPHAREASVDAALRGTLDLSRMQARALLPALQPLPLHMRIPSHARPLDPTPAVRTRTTGVRRCESFSLRKARRMAQPPQRSRRLSSGDRPHFGSVPVAVPRKKRAAGTHAPPPAQAGVVKIEVRAPLLRAGALSARRVQRAAWARGHRCAAVPRARARAPCALLPRTPTPTPTPTHFTARAHG